MRGKRFRLARLRTAPITPVVGHDVARPRVPDTISDYSRQRWQKGGAKTLGGVMTRPRAADDFAAIRARMEEPRRERRERSHRLSTFKRHVVGHYGLGEALEGECANLFGYDTSP